MAFDFKLVFVGLCMFRVVEDGKSMEVWLVNATRTSPARSAICEDANLKCRYEMGSPKCPDEGYKPSCDGRDPVCKKSSGDLGQPPYCDGYTCNKKTLLPPEGPGSHVPRLVFRWDQLHRDDREELQDQVSLSPRRDGRQDAALSLLGRWVYLKPGRREKPIQFPERCSPGQDHPRWWKADSNAMGEKSSNGWLAPLWRELSYKGNYYESKLISEMPKEDSPLASVVTVQDGRIQARKPFKERGDYGVFHLKPHLKDGPAKSLTDGVVVELRSQMKVAVYVCEKRVKEESELCGCDRVLFKGLEDGDVEVAVTNLPDRPVKKESALDHFAWFYELVKWKPKNGGPPCPGALPIPMLSDMKMTSSGANDDEEDDELRMLVTKNAFCPVSQRDG